MSVKKMLRCVAAVLVVASLLPSLACMGRIQQAAQKAQESNDLKQLGMSYHSYIDTNSKPPATLDELAAFEDKSFGPSPATSGLRSGKYIVYLGVEVTKLPAGASNTVLGYESSVPTAGGPVVMADGMVKNMTAAEFTAATKPAGAKLSKP